MMQVTSSSITEEPHGGPDRISPCMGKNLITHCICLYLAIHPLTRGIPRTDDVICTVRPYTITFPVVTTKFGPGSHPRRYLDLNPGATQGIVSISACSSDHVQSDHMTGQTKQTQVHRLMVPTNIRPLPNNPFF